MGGREGEQSWAFRKISKNCKEQGGEEEEEAVARRGPGRIHRELETSGNWRVVEKRKEKKRGGKKKEARVTRTGEGKVIEKDERGEEVGTYDYTPSRTIMVVEPCETDACTAL